LEGSQAVLGLPLFAGRKYSYDLKGRLRNFIKGVLFSVCYFVGSFAKKERNTGVLFLSPHLKMRNSALVRDLRKRGLQRIFVLIEDYGGISIKNCFNQDDHYFSLGLIRIRNKKIEEDFRQRWMSLLEKPEDFSSKFIYEGVDYWEILRKRIRFLFLKKFVNMAQLMQDFSKFLSKQDINIILTNNGVTYPDKMFVKIGLQFKIPSLIILLGLVGHPVCFLPVESSRVAAWGPACKEWFMRYGVPADKLVVTGNPKFDKYKLEDRDINKEYIYNKYRIKEDEKIFVYTGQYCIRASHFRNVQLPIKEHINIILNLARTTSEFNNIRLVVKFHPSDENSDFIEKMVSNILGKHNIIFIKRIDLKLLFACAEAVFTCWSTTALEAMIVGLPVVILNFTGRAYKNDIPFVEKKAALLARDTKELREVIDKVLNGGLEDMKSSRDKFIYDNAYEQDGKASERVAGLIDQMVSR